MTLFRFQWRRTYKSVRMSRCLKRSLGSCCRLLFERDLKESVRKIVIRVSALSKSFPEVLDFKCNVLAIVQSDKWSLRHISPTKYLQMSQGFESSEGILRESLDVIILNEPEKRTNHSYVTQWWQTLKFSQYYRMSSLFGGEEVLSVRGTIGEWL